ncbi:MAG: CDP-diacylglycerol--glycerol-3-phosphate 3-phosphatidyltransferase [Alphaproteobacteria bacterium]|nr:CDP-diacylglycerol--glycerol-3-phosphate 3-phosphatidyltransferase [Alphaproteobacteria bacterium]
MLTSLPNLLTLSRVGAIPLIIALFYVPGDWPRYVACIIFSAAGFTDVLDGYLARSRAQVSSMGRILDPIADKLLVVSTIAMLLAFDRIAGWSVLGAVVILCRELMVSGLREVLADIRLRVPVSRLAKWKTAIQMVALGFLIVGDAGWHLVPVVAIGDLLLWIAVALTLYTGWAYFRAAIGAVLSGRQRSPRGGAPAKVAKQATSVG